MLLADSFAVLALLTLLSLTGFSYYVEKFKLVDKLLAYRWPRLFVKSAYRAGFLGSIILLAFDPYLASILFYLSLLGYIVVKTDNLYRWMPNIIKTGIIFIVVYLILRHAQSLSWWDWLRIRPS